MILTDILLIILIVEITIYYIYDIYIKYRLYKKIPNTLETQPITQHKKIETQQISAFSQFSPIKVDHELAQLEKEFDDIEDKKHIVKKEIREELEKRQSDIINKILDKFDNYSLSGN